jgi:alpha-glucosidase
VTAWWRDAVVYQVYLRSFADASGDGLGDLAGVVSRLDYLAGLGVDALWLTPCYRSPDHDHGYDITDHRAIDPRFGDLADFDTLVDGAHERGLRVVLDVVANHTSTEHPWFRAAVAGDPVARTRYVIRRGRGPGGVLAPNSWQSLFGGSAWAPLDDGDWYLHLFDVHQADLDIQGPGVLDDLERTLRFWLDRGVDGLRFDAAGSLAKDPDLAEEPARRGPGVVHPFSDRPEVHDVYRRWAKVLAEYSGERLGVAETWGPAWVGEPYLRPDELGQAFAMDPLFTPLKAGLLGDVLASYLSAAARHGRRPAWVHGNHDVTRAATRWGRDGSLALLFALLALPGACYLYAGDELGLPEVPLPAAVRTDPGSDRDGCRVPLPWTRSGPAYGFGGRPWLPQPAGWGDLSVQAQAADQDSFLLTVRAALLARRGLWRDADPRVRWLPGGPGVLAFCRGPATCVVNLAGRPARLDRWRGAPVLTSAPLTGAGALPRRAAAWLVSPPSG